MVTKRQQKFDELLLREISYLLHEIEPDNIFSITQVHISKDLSFAKVWVSIVSEGDEMIKNFQSHARAIRKELSLKIVARRVPSLYFVKDITEEQASKIDKLLGGLK